MKKIVKLTALSFLIGVAALNLVLVAKTDNPFDLTLSDLEIATAFAACETVTTTTTSGPYTCVDSNVTSGDWVSGWPKKRICGLSGCPSRWYYSSTQTTECTVTTTVTKEVCD